MSLFSSLRAAVAGKVQVAADVRPSPPFPRNRGSRMDAYEATSTSQRVQDWETRAYGPNAALDDSATARARTQAAVRNNPWLRRAVRLLVSHMIGCGIQPRPKVSDAALRTAILEKWNAWCEESDADGVLGFYAQQSLLARSRAESGEVFARLVWRSRRDGLVVPLQIQALEADLLPVGMNDSGRNIRQGIERNREGKRIAYHFYREHPGDRFLNPGIDNTVRIPADEILHYYTPDRPGQLRGMPDGVSTLYRARNLDLYESAELSRKKSRSRFVGAIYTDTPEENPLTDAPANPILIELQRQLSVVESSAEYLAGDATALANADTLREQIVLEQEKKTFVDIEDAYMLQLGMSQRADLYSGDTGNAGHLDFLRSHLRSIAAGWGVPYELMVGDTADTNDRMMRVILNVFYRDLESSQDQLISQVLQPIYRAWLATAVLSGALSIPAYAADPRAFERCEWRSQAWTYVNPLQEIQTKVLKVRHGFSSRAAEVAGDGWDVEDIDQQNADDRERERRLDLSYGGDVATAPEKP